MSESKTSEAIKKIQQQIKDAERVYLSKKSAFEMEIKRLQSFCPRVLRKGKACKGCPECNGAKDD